MNGYSCLMPILPKKIRRSATTQRTPRAPVQRSRGASSSLSERVCTLEIVWTLND